MTFRPQTAELFSAARHSNRATFIRGFIAGAVAGAVLLGAVLGVAVREHRSTVTVQPPCYVRVPGFQLPTGARWC